MNKLIRELKSKMSEFRSLCIDDPTKENKVNKIKEIIDVAGDMFVENTHVYTAINDDESLIIWKEEDRKYIIMYTEPEMVGKEIRKFAEVDCRELFTFAFSKDNDVNGVIVNPEDKNTFCFEDWILSSVFYKGIGVDTLHIYSENSDEAIGL